MSIFRNKSIIRNSIFALTFASSIAQAGIILLSPMPKGMVSSIEASREIVKQAVDDKNQRADTTSPIIAYWGKYAGHITLNYLSHHQELTIEELLKAMPGLKDDFTQIANTRGPVQLINHLKVTINVWPGRGVCEIDGQKFKNYALLVAEVEPSDELRKLVSDNQTVVDSYDIPQEEGNPQQKLDFKCHGTIAYICNKNDNANESLEFASAIKEEIQKYMTEKMTEIELKEFLIKSFYLSANKGTKEEFKFANQ